MAKCILVAMVFIASLAMICPKLARGLQAQERGSGRGIEADCRLPGQEGEKPKCPITSLPEAQPDEPDDDIGLPRRTQGSGSR